MTVAAVATKAITGQRAPGPRLATPGAVLMLGGLALLWWGLGIFRGETSGAATVKNFNRDLAPDKPPMLDGADGHGGADARLQ